MLPSVFDNALPRLPIPSRSLTEQLHGTVERLSLVELLNIANEAYDGGDLTEYSIRAPEHPEQGWAILSPSSSFGKSATLLTRTLLVVNNSRAPGASS